MRNAAAAGIGAAVTTGTEGREMGDIEDARHTAGSAIDELRRWQYSDDIHDIRHSIDMAIRILERI